MKEWINEQGIFKTIISTYYLLNECHYHNIFKLFLWIMGKENLDWNSKMGVTSPLADVSFSHFSFSKQDTISNQVYDIQLRTQHKWRATRPLQLERLGAVQLFAFFLHNSSNVQGITTVSQRQGEWQPNELQQTTRTGQEWVKVTDNTRYTTKQCSKHSS